MTHRLISSRLAAFTLTLAVALAGASTLLVLPTATQAASASAAESADTETAFLAAQQRFQRAANDPSEVDAAADAMTQLSAAHPADPVLMAYAGAATAMRATGTLLPWRKMSFAEDGLALLDKSLALLTPAHDAPAHRGTPASLEVRFTAASTFLKLPGLFKRHARGEKLLDEVLNSPLLAGSPLPFRGAVWLRAAAEAQASQRPADARRWLQQVISSGAPQAASAQAQLTELGA
jgi:hypothetical protein